MLLLRSHNEGSTPWCLMGEFLIEHTGKNRPSVAPVDRRPAESRMCRDGGNPLLSKLSVGFDSH